MIPRRWTLSAFYHVSWIVFLIEAALLSWQSELIPFPLLLLSLFGSLWCLIPSGRFRRIPAFPRWGRLAAVLVLSMAVLQHYLATRDLASLLGTLLWASLLLFIPRKQKHLGHWIALLVTALIGLMSVILKQEFFTHLVFLGFLLTLVFTLNANNLFSLAGAAGAVRYRLSLRYFRQITPALIWGLFGGGLVFFLFPRTQLFSNPWGLREREAVTGYTGQVTLDTSGSIREDTTIALTVEADPKWLLENAQSLYFRGNTLDRFDGTKWGSTEGERWPYHLGEDVRYTLLHSPLRVGARIYREPHSTAAILYPGVLLNFRGPESMLGGSRYDSSRSLYRSSLGSLRYAYDVIFSDVPALHALDPDLKMEQLTADWGRERARRYSQPESVVPSMRYLQVPESVTGAEYFLRWKKEVLGDKPPVRVAKILSALSLNFASKFTPTLVHETTAPTALEGFIGQDRRGHCEYFATAAALFLRNQGIPTRIVLGYRGGSFNRVSHTLEVRERNAHAWLEVYGGRGIWYRYDPTPAIHLGVETGFLADASNYYSAVKFWFNRYVVHYDRSAQRQVWVQVALLSGRGFKEIPKWRGFLDLLRWIGLVLAIWLVPRMIRRRRRRLLDALPPYYQLFLLRLERAGWLREPGETFSRFHGRLRKDGWDAFSIGRLDEALHRDLYSPRPLPYEEVASLRTWVGGLTVQKKVASSPQSK